MHYRCIVCCINFYQTKVHNNSSLITFNYYYSEKLRTVRPKFGYILGNMIIYYSHRAYKKDTYYCKLGFCEGYNQNITLTKKKVKKKKFCD